jgi:hypothetical protein
MKPYDEIQLRDMVASMYKNEDGNPVILTPTQIEIFATISMRLYPRVHCETFTRFGKSRTTALAVLTRVATFPEKWAIVAGTKDKAKIIMNYVNAHIFDNEFTASRFRMDKGDSAESIRRHRNKNHITFDVGGGLIGELFICTAKEALGFGAQNVIEDESALIEDNDHALVMRMLGDNPDDNFLFKIGNPFFRNHFLKSRLDPAYHKILVDCYKGVHEGRINQSNIDEASKYSYFKVLYECKFPNPEDIDEKGWSYLLNENDIELSVAREQEPYGTKRLGVDVARGGRNYNVWVVRGENYAKVVKKDLDNDLMSVAGKTIAIMREEGIVAENVAIDDVGVGGGVVDRIREQGYSVVAVKEGATATEKEIYYDENGHKKERIEFTNLKAQLYAGKNGLANWIKRTGKLEPHEGWAELTRLRFKKHSNGATKMESKDDMRARGEESPDVADALMLTFAPMTSSTREYTPVDPALILAQGKRALGGFSL